MESTACATIAVVWGDRIAERTAVGKLGPWWRYVLLAVWCGVILIVWIVKQPKPWPGGLVWFVMIGGSLWLARASYLRSRRPIDD